MPRHAGSRHDLVPGLVLFSGRRRRRRAHAVWPASLRPRGGCFDVYRRITRPNWSSCIPPAMKSILFGRYRWRGPRFPVSTFSVGTDRWGVLDTLYDGLLRLPAIYSRMLTRRLLAGRDDSQGKISSAQEGQITTHRK